VLIRFIGCFLCVVGLSAATSISITTSDEQAGSGESGHGCQLLLTTDKPKYEVGKPINLHILVSNNNRDPIDYFGEDYVGYSVEVFLPNGDPSPKSLWGERNMPPKASAETAGGTVLPGKTVTEELLAANRGFDMTEDGKYAIVVHRAFCIESQPGKWFDVPSNKIFVELYDARK
jgi:hypothetical protein